MQKENIFIHKILPILSILILVSFIFINNNVFAFSESVDINSNSYNCFIPDKAYNTFVTLEEYNNNNYKFFVYCGDSLLHVYFFPKNMDIKIWKSNSGGGFQSNYESITDFSCIYYSINESDGLINTTDKNRTSFTNARSGYYVSGSNHYFYTNINIYTDNTCTAFFFQIAPLTLEPILGKVEMTQEITTTIVGLAKLLIPLLICLLGFWKAWQLLSRLLHKA